MAANKFSILTDDDDGPTTAAAAASTTTTTTAVALGQKSFACAANKLFWAKPVFKVDIISWHLIFKAAIVFRESLSTKKTKNGIIKWPLIAPKSNSHSVMLSPLAW